MQFKGLLLSFLILMEPMVMADGTSLPLFDFTQSAAEKEWQTVNDGVMGGVSEGRFKITEAKTLEFSGTLSLENNGGFASVRTKPKKLSLDVGDSLVARVRGDGREYRLNLYVKRPRIAFAYQAAVATTKDEWVEVKIPLDQFEATSFGQPVKDAGPVNPEEVNGLGFLLSDKNAGPFRLEIESIRIERIQPQE